MGEIAVAGNKGKGVRSDCFVTIELADRDGARAAAARAQPG